MSNDSAGAALRVLIVEDSQDDAELIAAEIEAAGRRVEYLRVDTEATMSRALIAQDWDVVLSDYNMPSFSATEALDVLLRVRGEAPFIIVSGMIGEEAAVALVKSGATDFVMKNNLRRLPASVERSLREVAVRRSHRATINALAESEARFKALVANLPGLVFQAVLTPAGPRSWPFISDGCQPLLGVPAAALADNPGLFAEMLHPEDRASFAEQCRFAIAHMKNLNWEGRLHVGPAQEVKWVNIRASLRGLPGESTIAEGTISNITQGKVAESEIVCAHEQLRELSRHLDTVKEQERTDIAHEIHDELGGTLTAAKIDTLSLMKQLPPERIDLASRAASVEALLDQALDITRRISRRLRPPVLDFGIVAGIEWQARDFSKRVGLACEFNCRDEEIELEAARSTAAFRILQEALTNIAKHADATHVWIDLEVNQADRVVLRIADDGCGISEEDILKSGSFGIRGMRERAKALDGTLRVSAPPAGGTEIELTFPRAAHDAPPQLPRQESLL